MCTSKKIVYSNKHQGCLQIKIILIFKIQVEIKTDNKLKLADTSNKAFKTCSCPNDKITHKFDLAALFFKMNNGLKLYVKVKQKFK